MSEVRFCPHNPDEACECRIYECPCCAGLGVAAKCAGCNGLGYVQTRSKRNAELAHVPMMERCLVCHGIGYQPITTDLYERLGFVRPTAVDYVYRRRPPQKSSVF